jgi:hypothetical protein
MWQPFVNLHLTFAVSRRVEQLRLRAQQRIVATAEEQQCAAAHAACAAAAHAACAAARCRYYKLIGKLTAFLQLQLA